MLRAHLQSWLLECGSRADPHFLILFNTIRKFWRWQVISREHQINDEIRAREVRFVGAEGEQIGIKSIREALQMAIDLNLGSGEHSTDG